MALTIFAFSESDFLIPYMMNLCIYINICIIINEIYLYKLQFTPFLTAECTFDFTIKVFAVACFFIICMVTHNSFWVNASSVSLPNSNII